jgi:hypothetical protein
LTGINSSNSDTSGLDYVHKDLDLTIVHAQNDIEIPWREGRRVWTAATGENIKGAPGAVVYQKSETVSPSQIEIWENRITGKDGSQVVKKVRWERVRYGGMSAR